MDDSSHHSEAKSEIAQEKPRDSEGHFIHVDKPDSSAANSSANPSHTNPISQFLHDETAIHKSNKDELIDIHVGNPLRRITQLLEEIKRQKAFSFTLKGSLGIMGVALALGTFGVFGGTKALCDKGIQTKMGVIRQLSFQEEEAVSFLNDIPVLNMLFKKPTTNRTILIQPNNTVIHLVLKKYVTLPTALQTTYFATGSFDSCSQTLSVISSDGIQMGN